MLQRKLFEYKCTVPDRYHTRCRHLYFIPKSMERPVKIELTTCANKFAYSRQRVTSKETGETVLISNCIHLSVTYCYLYSSRLIQFYVYRFTQSHTCKITQTYSLTYMHEAMNMFTSKRLFYATYICINFPECIKGINYNSVHQIIRPFVLLFSSFPSLH